MSNKTIGLVVLIAAVLVAAIVVFGNKDVSTPSNSQNGQNQTSKAPSPCDNSPTKDVIMVGNSDQGNYLTDSKCMTLYVTSTDKAGTSSCNDTCAENWPPFAYDNIDVAALPEDLYKMLNVIKRKDGTYQYAFGNTPLYYYKGDAKVGDIKGNGMNNGTWSILLIDKQGTK